MAAATSIVRAHQIVLGEIDRALAPHGLTLSRFEALAVLHFTRTGAMPMGKLGDRLQVHPASVTNTVGRLEAAGLVRRMPSPDDRRTVLAEITDEGRRVVVEASGALRESAFGLHGLAPRRLDAITRALLPVRRAADRFG